MGGRRDAHREDRSVSASAPTSRAIVDAANAATATLRNEVIGTQANDVTRDPARLRESEMGNLVADAMRRKYPGVDAALTNSGGLRADIVCSPPSAGEQACEITWGEVFAVLPFGNRTVIETVTGAQLKAALLNGLQPTCNPTFAGGTGRSPQVSGLKVEYSCSGGTPSIVAMYRAPDGPTGTLTPIADADTVRLVTNDFMYTGGDGYTALTDRHRRPAARRRAARHRHRLHQGPFADRPQGRRAARPEVDAGRRSAASAARIDPPAPGGSIDFRADS